VSAALVEPSPPRAAGMPGLGAALPFLRNPTAYLRELRQLHGDTFLLPLLHFRLFVVLSPDGLRSLYELAEEDASFTEATRTLIGFKLPAEMLEGDLSLFRHLFTPERMPGFLAQMRAAVDETLTALGRAGEFELFTHMKGLVHRIGFRCWIGREATTPQYFSRLVALFERLDPEEAFIRPGGLVRTILTRKAPERRALRETEAILGEIWASRQQRGVREHDMLERLHEAYADRPPAEQHARAARDVMILHLASQTNLYAALGWTFLNLLRFPTHGATADAEAAEVAAALGPGWLADLRALGRLTRLEQCAYESIRLAQRSLTLRKVLRPCRVRSGGVEYALQAGVYVATLLSVTNTPTPALEQFDPAHFERGRLAAAVGLPAREMVSTFGHGRHACVGEHFALAAIKIAVARHRADFDFTTDAGDAAPPPAQMGAVARAAAPCAIGYRRRAA
jgi:cytochrome P450